MKIIGELFFWIEMLALCYILTGYVLCVINIFRMMVGLGSYVKEERYADYYRFAKSENTIPVSIIVPAYNEASSVVDTVHALLDFNFPEYEIIVVNDGSLDNTLLLLKLEYELIALQQPYKRSLKTEEITAIYRSPLYANLIVVDKAHGGKADALNCGINISSYPVFATVDADSVLDKDCLVKIIMPFVNDFKLIALSGIVRAVSGWTLGKGSSPENIGLSKNALGNLQTVEYIRTFLTGRRDNKAIGMQQVLSGSFGAFNKNAVIQVGGYSIKNMGADMELIMRLHQYMLDNDRPYSMRFLTTPVCYKKSPETYKELLLQRQRWHLKLMDSLYAYKDMRNNKKYGKLGTQALPYYWAFELYMPAAECAGYAILLLAFLFGGISGMVALNIFIALGLFGVILSMGALLIEERSIKKYNSVREMLRLVLYCFLDSLGYRQINSICCLIAMYKYKKSKQALKSK